VNKAKFIGIIDTNCLIWIRFTSLRFDSIHKFSLIWFRHQLLGGLYYMATNANYTGNPSLYMMII